jgi:hypothetical protein
MMDMATIQLVSSDRTKNAVLAAELSSKGYQVEAGLMSEDVRRRMLASPPDAIIFDLDRAPATGRDLGLFFRVQLPTRHCLLVFLDGKPGQVNAIRTLLPDACYSTADTLTEDLERGLQSKPADPIVPSSVFAGYRGRPLAAKLGIKRGMSVALIDAPEDFEASLALLPEQVKISRTADKASLTLWFTTNHADLMTDLKDRLSMANPGKIWIIWPKRSSGVSSDLTQARVRQAGLGANWVDFKVCSIDDTWTGLCFTARQQA